MFVLFSPAGRFTGQSLADELGAGGARSSGHHFDKTRRDEVEQVVVLVVAVSLAGAVIADWARHDHRLPQALAIGSEPGANPSPKDQGDECEGVEEDAAVLGNASSEAVSARRYGVAANKEREGERWREKKLMS